MSETKFIFNSIPEEELLKYYDGAFIFNESLKEIKDLTVYENKIKNESLGNSEERVDIFIVAEEPNKFNTEEKAITLSDDLKTLSFLNTRDIISMEECFEQVSNSGSGFYNIYKIISLLESLYTFDGVLIIKRAVSDMVLDKVDCSFFSQYFYITSEEVSLLLNRLKSLSGYLALKRFKAISIKHILDFLKDEFEQDILGDYQYFKYIRAIESAGE